MAETFNSLNAELNPICHLLALLGAHLIFHINRIRVKAKGLPESSTLSMRLAATFVNCVCNWWGNLKEVDHWGDPGVDGKIILGWIFGKWDVGVWTGWS
jgi:hypothetical protein